MKDLVQVTDAAWVQPLAWNVSMSQVKRKEKKKSLKQKIFQMRGHGRQRSLFSSRSIHVKVPG